MKKKDNVRTIMSIAFVAIACYLGQTDRLNGIFTLLLWIGWQLEVIRERP